jgi:hypothetical protein
MAASAGSDRSPDPERPALARNIGKAKRRAPMAEQGTLWPDGDAPPVRRLKTSATGVTLDPPYEAEAGGLDDGGRRSGSRTSGSTS